MSKFQKISISVGYTLVGIAGALAWTDKHLVVALVLSSVSFSVLLTTGFAAAAGDR